MKTLIWQHDALSSDSIYSFLLALLLHAVLVLPVIAPGNVHLSASLATTSREGGAEQELLPRPEAGKGFAGICEIKQEIRQYKHVCTSPCVRVCVCTFIFAYGQTASLLRAVSFARLVLCVELPVCSDIRRHFLLLISCFFFSFLHILLSRHAHVLCPARQPGSHSGCLVLCICINCFHLFIRGLLPAPVHIL